MSAPRPITLNRMEFDLVLDQSPRGAAGDALQSLIASGDVVAVGLPYGFVGLTIVHSQTLVYVEAGRLRLRQVLPVPPAVLDPKVRQYQYRARPL